jgi:hypothetical protein
VNEHGDVFFYHALTKAGTLRPHVRGHDVKKDISMLMRLTKDNYVAFNKGQGEFS